VDIIEALVEMFDVLGDREEVGVNLWGVVVVSHVSIIIELWLVEVRWEGILLGNFWAIPGSGVRCP